MQKVPNFQKKGAALILAIVALSMLVIIAIPFASSMAVEKRASSNSLAKTQAKIASEGAINYAISRLNQTHEMLERKAKKGSLFATPYFDTPDEYKVDIKLPSLNTNDPKGAIWTVKVEDEQGKINLHTATPWLIGNLIASAITQKNIASNETEILVDSTLNFPEKNGLLWANGELIRYARKEKDKFLQCKRGLQKNKPNFLFPQNIRRGTLIVDARAYRIVSQQSILGFFRTIEEIKTIANTNGDFAISPEAFSRILPCVTVHSQNQAGSKWIHSQQANLVPSTDISEPDIFIVANTLYYSPGMLVKISDNKNSELAMVLGKSKTRIFLDKRIIHRFNNKKIAIASPTSININTAPARVLFAIFKGLRVGKNWISAEEATRLVDEILVVRSKGGFFSSIEGFGKFLNDMRTKHIQIKDKNGAPFFSKAKIRRLLSAATSINGLRKRFHGINNINTSSNYRQPIPPLSPISFSSEEIYTIKSIAVINNSSGIPLAEQTRKKVVNIVPSQTLTWSIDTQLDFQHQLDRRPSVRVLSHPNFIDPLVQFPKDKKDSNTGITIDTFTTDYRSPNGSRTIKLDTFNNTYDGAPGEQSVALETSKLEVKPGCVSMWFKVINPTGKIELFNMGERQKNQNRISCFIEQGQLFLQVYDGTLQNARCEIVARINVGNRWNHLMATWYGTDYGGLALWIDGQPVGEFQYNIEGRVFQGVLSQKIKSNARKIRLSTTQGLPRKGAVKIGTEIIEYQSISGTSLIVRKSYSGFQKNILARGARGTITASHEKGVPVIPLGYSAPIRSEIFPATKLISKIGKNDTFSKTKSALNSTEDKISIENNDGFARVGFALIIDSITRTKEIVRYSNSDKKTLRNCSRGQLNTSAKEFETGAFVIPLSIEVDDQSEYPNSGTIQIDNEWIKYNSKVDKNILVFNIDQDAINNLLDGKTFEPTHRATNKTISSVHFGGQLILPVFATLEPLGKFDEVTLVNENNFSEQESLEINWANGNLAAFTEDVSRLYEPDNQKTRILKFPSGESPSEVKSMSIGQKNLLIDELQVIHIRRITENILTETLNASSKKISLSNLFSLENDASFIKIGDEYISYTSIVKKELENVTRDFFRSSNSSNVFDLGTPVYPVFFISTSSLTKNFSSEKNILLNDSSDFPRIGYIKCKNEIIGYIENQQAGLILPNTVSGQGLRGSFGTTVTNHTSNSLVYFMPTRYWDQAIITSNDNESAFFEVAKTATGAFWKKISWQTNLPSKNFMEVKILARINGEPDWVDTPSNKAGGIFQFTNPSLENKINVQGDFLELRVYFLYKRGAFNSEFWKDTPIVKAISAEYEQFPKIFEAE